MNVESILEELAFLQEDRRFPRQALEQAIERRQEITPRLLEILEETRTNHAEIIERPAYMAHVYAMFLLAQSRERLAYPLIVELFSLPGDVPHRLVGDLVTEDLPRILASVCHGDRAPILGMIENRNVDEYVRGSAVNALLSLVVNNMATRDEVVAYFRELFDGKLERSPSHVWGVLVNACADLRALELLDSIRAVYEEGLVEPGLVSPGDVEEAFSLSEETLRAQLVSNPHYALVDDVIAEIGWWVCFEKPKREKRSSATELVGAVPRESRKVGRNQPCPCGSGKKYKKCCGSRRG